MLKPWELLVEARSHWDGVPIKPSPHSAWAGAGRLSEDRGRAIADFVRPGLEARIEDAAPRFVGEINKGSRSAGQVLNLEGLGALDRFTWLREGSYAGDGNA